MLGEVRNLHVWPLDRHGDALHVRLPRDYVHHQPYEQTGHLERNLVWLRLFRIRYALRYASHRVHIFVCDVHVDVSGSQCY